MNYTSELLHLHISHQDSKSFRFYHKFVMYVLSMNDSILTFFLFLTSVFFIFFFLVFLFSFFSIWILAPCHTGCKLGKDGEKGDQPWRRAFFKRFSDLHWDQAGHGASSRKPVVTICATEIRRRGNAKINSLQSIPCRHIDFVNRDER